jgi:membrane fusion protein (multidrug efflux system)
MRRNSYLITTLATFLLVFAGCGKKAAAITRPQGPQAISVTVATVTNVAWDKTVSVIGTLFAKDSATTAAQVDGQVEKTLVDFGDRVKAGQDLAFIDTKSYLALLQQAEGNVAKAEANFKNAKQNFDRVESLRKQGVASESDYDAARAQYAQWEAELKAAQGTEAVAKLNVERSRVQAPFDGAISQRIVGRGDYVKIGSPLFDLVSDGVLKFIFPVPEKYASYVKKKLPVSFTVDNYPGETFTGTVYLISPEVSRTNRSFNVGALVTNTDFRLKANTFARGSLIIEQGASTPVVPIEAVVNFAGVTKVFVLENNNIARSRTVETGRARNGLQEIISGLKPGETVVASGNSKLADGTAVTIRPTSESGQPLVAQHQDEHERR